MFPEELKDYDTNKERKLSTVSISMFLLTKLVTEVFYYMGDCLNIDRVRRPTINMKNEFLYSRLEMTPSKKHYAGILLAQEGNIFDVPQPDIKGLAIRKTSVNYNLRQYFNKTLISKILEPEKINLIDVYKDFSDMEEIIKHSLREGKTEFTEPGKVNEISSYTNPFTIQTVRGSLLWNAMYPDNPIQPPDKINFIKIKSMSCDEFINIIPEEFKESVRNLYNDPSTQANANCPKALRDYGVTIFCFPKNIKKIPEFLIDLIDIDIMVMDSIRPCMEILEPLGFQSLNIDSNSFSTNIIKL